MQRTGCYPHWCVRQQKLAVCPSVILRLYHIAEQPQWPSTSSMRFLDHSVGLLWRNDRPEAETST
jgi:hypothetical protein